jgi:SAM-dependent methyltransferase
VRLRRSALAAAAFVLLAAGAEAQAPAPPASGAQQPYIPKVGQAGKDVVWVPTPPELVETMLDLAKVTKDDFVIDLGSGDGRNIIAAARRGARGLGVEFNPEMVALSQQHARDAGVADRASFVQGDMYLADISRATVMAVYLLPTNMDTLLPRFQALEPGTRIVANTFGFSDWDPDERDVVRESACTDWCEALLWIVPARVAGRWLLDSGALLELTQLHQVLHGTLQDEGVSTPVAEARVRGYEVSFTVGERVFTGRLSGDRLDGAERVGLDTRAWHATRQP